MGRFYAVPPNPSSVYGPRSVPQSDASTETRLSEVNEPGMTEEQRYLFDTFGYLVLPDVLTEA